MRPWIAVQPVDIEPSCSSDNDDTQPVSAPSSAAQPASSSSGAAQPADSELLASTPQLTVGFYNVNREFYNVEDRTWKDLECRLKSDIVKAFEVHALDILCLCGLNENIRGGDIDAWTRVLIYDSAVQPARVYAKKQYSTIVMSGQVAILQCTFVDDYVTDQPYRCFQHLRVRVGDDREAISIVNCYAHRCGWTVDARRQTFLACHRACADDRFIWGGEFSTGTVQLSSMIEKIDSRMTINASAAQPGSLHSLTYGLRSVQTDSKVGAQFKGASDKYNLVIANVFGLNGWRSEQTNAKDQSSLLRITSAKPPLTWISVNQAHRQTWNTKSAERRALDRPLVLKPAKNWKPQPSVSQYAKHSSHSSAAQPVTLRERRPHVRLKARTPRVDAIFSSDASAEQALQQLLESISKDFLWGRVAKIVQTPNGCYEAAVAPDITEKLEEFLRVVEDQRAKHVRRHPHLRNDDVFKDNDMREIMTTWCNDITSWMNTETRQEYDRLQNRGWNSDKQNAHNMRRSAFSSYMFQIIGNKDVVRGFIQNPVCCPGQPAQTIQRFTEQWHMYENQHKDKMKKTWHRR